MPVIVELAQLFNCQQMPEKLCNLVQEVVFDVSGNGCYYELFEISPEEEEDYDDDYLAAHKTLTKWLRENGYDPKYKCLINVWW